VLSPHTSIPPSRQAVVVVVEAVVVVTVDVVSPAAVVDVVSPAAVVDVVSPAAVDVESHEAAQTLLQQLSPVSQRPILMASL